MNSNSLLKKYLQPSIGGSILMELGGIVLMAVSVAIFFGEYLGSMILRVLIGVAVFALGAYLAVTTPLSFVKFSKKMTELETDGTYDRTESDFLAAEQHFSDKLRLGKEYIYSKGLGDIIRYEDVKKVYQYIQKRNGFEQLRQLRVELTSGKVITLAGIPIKGKADAEVEEVVVAMLSKNSAIKVGYKD